MINIQTKTIGDNEAENNVELKGMGDDIFIESVSAVKSLHYALKTTNVELAEHFIDAVTEYIISEYKKNQKVVFKDAVETT